VTTVNNTAYPGEVFELGLEALDEINQRTAAVIRISDSDDQAILPQPINFRPLKKNLPIHRGNTSLTLQ
jgi:hypothetical protein